MCVKYECSHKTILTPSQMTIPVSSLLRQGGWFLEGAVQQRSSLDSSLPGDKVHTELAITFPNPLLEAEGREM